MRITLPPVGSRRARPCARRDHMAVDCITITKKLNTISNTQSIAGWIAQSQPGYNSEFLHGWRLRVSRSHLALNPSNHE